MSQKHLDAYALLTGQSHGILSTQGVRYPGYPLGSVVPYVLDASGNLIILISDIAQHTVNLKADPRCSLTVTERTTGEVQAGGRLSILVDARCLGPEEAAESSARYLRFFPEAQGYFSAHAFRFWALTPHKLRFIGGFGRIHWLDPDISLATNPFFGTTELRASTHMNKDHTDALHKYCQFNNIASSGRDVAMIGVDSRALYLRVDADVHRLAFRQSISTLDALRRETIAMCQPGYWQDVKAA